MFAYILCDKHRMSMNLYIELKNTFFTQLLSVHVSMSKMLFANSLHSYEHKMYIFFTI